MSGPASPRANENGHGMTPAAKPEFLCAVDGPDAEGMADELDGMTGS